MLRSLFVAIMVCYVLVLVPLMVCIVGCQRTRSIDLNASFALSPSELFKCQQAANTGDSNAAATLAWYYLMYARDSTNGFRWLEYAAAVGHRESQYNLGRMRLEDGPFQNISEGTNWLSLAAAAGDAKAMFYLGLHLSDGVATRESCLVAAAWLMNCLAENCKLTADQQQEAHVRLAQIYASERGSVDAQKRAYLHALYAETLVPPGTIIQKSVIAVRTSIEKTLGIQTVEEVKREFRCRRDTQVQGPEGTQR